MYVCVSDKTTCLSVDLNQRKKKVCRFCLPGASKNVKEHSEKTDFACVVCDYICNRVWIACALFPNRVDARSSRENWWPSRLVDWQMPSVETNARVSRQFFFFFGMHYAKRLDQKDE